MEDLTLIVFLLGGFVGSLAIAISYLASRRFEWPLKLVLAALCLGPLVSLALVFGGLMGSGGQLFAAFPCILAGVLFFVSQASGRPALFLRSPIRGLAGIATISWSGFAAFLASHNCFMGACC